MTGKELLDFEFYERSLGTYLTVREWFKLLLQTLWKERDSFSGKHPLGDSDWDAGLVVDLIETGHIGGEIDDDGYLLNADYLMFDRLVSEAIAEL